MMIISHPSPVGPSPAICEFLESWPWYKKLPIELQSLVSGSASEKFVETGEFIARSGEPSAHWYGVLSGMLQMYVIGPDGDETTLYCLREGEWGGDGSLLKKELRRYDLRALTAAHICLIPAETFETLRDSSIDFNHYLCDLINSRMGEFVSLLVASRLNGPDVRVAKALLMLVANSRSDAHELTFPQHELALICGLSRQRVNAALSLLRRQGIVSTEPKKSSLVVQVRILKEYLKETT